MGTFKILTGDITSDEILKDHDLIVNPTNPYMLYGGGVCGAIFRKAGINELENFTKNNFNTSMKITEVRITPGFNLNMDIMFVQGPKVTDNNSKELLIKTYKNMLNEINKNNYKNIIIPSLGTGIYGFKHEDVGKLVCNLLNNYIKDKDINIDLVLYNESNKKYYII